MSKGWSDWHQIWYTCADSSGKGYTPNKLPRETQGCTWGVLGGQTFKSGKAVKHLDRLAPTLVHVCGFIWEWASRLNTSHPSIPQGACRGGGGGLGGHTFKSIGKLSNGWTDWHQIWYMSVDSSGNGHRLKQLAPRYPRAALWVVLWDQQFKRLGNCGQMAG